MAENTQSYPPRSNWSISRRGSFSDRLYALALIDLDDVIRGGVTSNIADALNGQQTLDDLSFREFAFSVNPKSMNLDEPAAVTIVPTQDGGQFIEHQGQIYKNITIAGTTGLRPNKTGNGAFIPIVGIGNPFAGQSGTDPETGLPIGEKTGFDDLIALRNIFRRYWDLKRDADRAHKTVMVWQNGKEGEYYVVEPMSFKTDRDASAPLTYTYSIQLRTIERLDVTQIKRQKDSYTARNGVDNFFQRISDIKRLLTASFTVVQSFTDRTATVGQAIINEVLTPVNIVIQALTGIITSGKRFFDIPKNALSSVATNATELATAIDSLPNNTYVSQGIATQIAIVANSYRHIARALNALIAEPLLVSTPLSTHISKKRQAYSNPTIGLPNSGGSPTDLGNLRSTNSAFVATIQQGEDIRAVAKRLLGDDAKWKILVFLNQLKQPYISDSGDGIDVFRPGDQILIPRGTTDSQSAIVPTEQKFSGISTFAQRLGRDIKLEAIESNSGVVLYDAAKSSNGDLAIVESTDNLGQAIVIKFSTEQKELPTHPFFGIRFPIGTKARLQPLIAFQINARATILADRRFESVDQLRVSTVGDVLNVQGTATAKGSDETLTLDLSVRR